MTNQFVLHLNNVATRVALRYFLIKTYITHSLLSYLLCYIYCVIFGSRADIQWEFVLDCIRPAMFWFAARPISITLPVPLRVTVFPIDYSFIFLVHEFHLFRNDYQIPLQTI